VEAPVLIFIGLMLVVGLIGIVLPVIPGLLLVWAGVLVWALVERSVLAWTVLAFASLVVAISQIIKYLLPGRRLQAAGVPLGSIVVGGILGVIGFFVLPIIGLLAGFVLGIFLAERIRLGPRGGAWDSTVHALKAAGLAIAIELLAGLIVTASWVAAVLATA
jgi:uncharacterized protein